jgi:hypothetical protein
MLRIQTQNQPSMLSETAAVWCWVGGLHAVARKLEKFSPFSSHGHANPTEELT